MVWSSFGGLTWGLSSFHLDCGDDWCWEESSAPSSGQFRLQHYLVCMRASKGQKGKEPACQCWNSRDAGLIQPRVRKIPWSRKLQPAPVFLPGKYRGQRGLVATVHGVAKSWTWVCTHTCTQSVWVLWRGRIQRSAPFSVTLTSWLCVNTQPFTGDSWCHGLQFFFHPCLSRRNVRIRYVMASLKRASTLPL